MIKNFSIHSFILGLMLGMVLIGTWALTTDGKLTLPDLSTPESTFLHDAQAASPSDLVSVNDQKAGSSVKIDSLTVPPPGVWIAIRDTNGTDLGNVLGAIRVKGPQTEITVPLLRATLANTSYAVELYRDNGDNEFDLSADSVYVDFDSGEPVTAYFKTLP